MREEDIKGRAAYSPHFYDGLFLDPILGALHSRHFKD